MSFFRVRFRIDGVARNRLAAGAIKEEAGLTHRVISMDISRGAFRRIGA
jgi:hypothetical protein